MSRLTCKNTRSRFFMSSDAKCCGNFEVGRSMTIDGSLKVKSNLEVGNNATFGGNSIMTGALSIEDDTGSINPITGALIVAGGVGIGENLNVANNATVGGTLLVDDSTVSSSNGTGALVVGGGVGVAGNLNVGGTTNLDGPLIVENNTGSSSSSTGAVVVTGGVGISGNLNVDGNITTSSRVYQGLSLLMPIGAIMPYAGSSSPGGYLLCDGTAVSRMTYIDLFGVIGTTFGVGNGTTTFNVPDMRGRMALGVSGSNALATLGGAGIASIGISELPAHTHTGTTDSAGSHSHSVSDPGHAHGQLNGRDDGNVSNQPGQAPPGDGVPNETGYPTQSATTGISIGSAGAHTHTFTTGSTGSGAAFSIMNPYVSLNYIIKF